MAHQMVPDSLKYPVLVLHSQMVPVLYSQMVMVPVLSLAHQMVPDSPKFPVLVLHFLTAYCFRPESLSPLEISSRTVPLSSLGLSSLPVSLSPPGLSSLPVLLSSLGLSSLPVPLSSLGLSFRPVLSSPQVPLYQLVPLSPQASYSLPALCSLPVLHLQERLVLRCLEQHLPPVPDLLSVCCLLPVHLLQRTLSLFSLSLLLLMFWRFSYPS